MSYLKRRKVGPATSWALLKISPILQPETVTNLLDGWFQEAKGFSPSRSPFRNANSRAINLSNLNSIGIQNYFKKNTFISDLAVLKLSSLRAILK
jgi:hypothetical protein